SSTGLARSIACPSRSNGFLIMAAATSPATPAASPATSGSNRGRRLSKVHRATEWLKPSFARSSATMSASVRDQMPKPSCLSCQLGSPTTTRFTRTRLSDIVHPVSSSQLTQDPDRVRSFGGYNSPHGSKQHLALAAPATRARTQRPRKYLAIHAAELAVEPDFQILPRHRRSLLLRLEHAHGSAVENHVQRSPRLGSRRSAI